MRAEPRAAAAAEPHKRQAVAAGTAVGVAVGEADGDGGKPPAEAGDTWTTVLSRWARRQARARPDGTACGAARKAAAVRAEATRRTVAAVIEHVGMEGE